LNQHREALRLLQAVYRQKYFAAPVDISEDLVRIVAQGLGNEASPVQLLYLWGAHAKEHANSYDEAGLGFLHKFVGYLKSALGSFLKLRFVIADVHAEVNGISPITIRRYVSEISDRACAFGWMVSNMSEVWSKHGITIENTQEAARKITDSEVDRVLLEFAQKHYLGSDKMQGAKHYMVARLLEKPALQQEFIDHIHITPSDRRMRQLEPDMPSFRIWTLHRGRSKRPWFMVDK
jgi:hypothetical protein